MSRSPWPLVLYAGAAVFGAVLLLQLKDVVLGDDTGGASMIAAPSPAAPTDPDAPALPGRDDRDTDASVRTILARPLFSQSRRPAAAPQGPAAAAVTSEAAEARLTGVVVGAGRRIALFVPETGKPMALVEGDRLGEWTIDRIEAKRVILRGPAGTKVLEPALPKGTAGGGGVPGMPDAPPGLAPDVAKFLKGLRQ